MFACAYFSDLGEAGSLAGQNQEFLDYCAQHGYEVQATFSDRAGERSGFLRLVEFLRPSPVSSPEVREFTVAIVPRVASLGSTNEVAAASYFALRESGARVVILDLDGYEGDQWPTSSAPAKDSLSQRVRTAMRKRALKGEVLGRPPYGYSPGRHHRLEPVAEEARVVRYMFKLYLRENLGVRLIARRLNVEGYRTRQQKLWTMVSVRDILRNRVYLGNYSRLGVKVPGSHTRLVSEDDFKRVQERMQQRRTATAERTAGGFLLAGLLNCGDCGNHMIGVTRRQTWNRKGEAGPHSVVYRYYQCQSRTNQGVCRYHTRRAGELETSLRESLRGSGNGSIVRRRRAGDEDGVLRSTDANLMQIDKQLKAIDSRLGRALGDTRRKQDARLLGRLSSERVDLELRRAALLAEATQLSTEEQRRAVRRRSLQRLLEQWETTPLHEAHEVLKDNIEKVDVYDDRLEITAY